MSTYLSPGDFLIANPQILDPHFSRSVVLILEDNPAGSLGLVINQPVDSPLGELWEQCPGHLRDLHACATGGPVHPDTGLLLHGLGNLPGSMLIAPGLWIGAEPSNLALAHHRLAKTNLTDKALQTHGPRLFLGHAGWDEGQLRSERLRGDWLTRPGHAALALNPTNDYQLWGELHSLGEANWQPSPN